MKKSNSQTQSNPHPLCVMLVEIEGSGIIVRKKHVGLFRFLLLLAPPHA